MADYIMNEPATLDFANGLFRDRDGKYSCYLLIDKSTPGGQAEAKAIAQAIQDAIKDGTRPSGNYPAPLAGLDPNDQNAVKRLSLPLKDGDKDVFALGEHAGERRADVYPEFAGHWFLKVSAGEHRMVDEGLVRDMSNRPVQASQVYSGNRVRANLWFAAWNNNGNRGVQARLNALLIVEPGEPLVQGGHGGDPFAGFGLPAADASAGGDPFANMGV